jgi:hypothetical protein
MWIAFRRSQSTFGFLLTGPGLSLLLDRYFTRLLPWPHPIAWGKEISLGFARFNGNAGGPGSLAGALTRKPGKLSYVPGRSPAMRHPIQTMR